MLGFVALVVLGALLLKLPISSQGGEAVPFLTALFTSTSAVCITGLTVVDTAQAWSTFGKVVILCLIQIGGLGFMAITTIFFFIMNRKIGLSGRLMIVKSLNLNDIQGVIGLVRRVLLGTLLFEGFGAIILWLRFVPEFGYAGGLARGVFHSVSALCNAGFNLLGDMGTVPGMARYIDDTAVMITLAVLVFVGGIGFFVWDDVFRKRSFRRLHVHSKLALIISMILILTGWVFFYFTERSNPYTIGAMTQSEAVLASLFQSVMTRSGGLSVFDQVSLVGISRMLTILLMLIGGSAGSTAGGIKNVTVGLVMISAVNSLRGKANISVFRRTIPPSQVISAVSIMTAVLASWLLGTVVIAFVQPALPFGEVLFETASAIATCGLSFGITSELVPASQAVIMLLMFFGRIGIMTLGMASLFKRGISEKTKHPDEWVMM